MKSPFFYAVHACHFWSIFDSLTKFVEDADDDCVRIVDSLLDVLTKGQHTLTKKQLEMVSRKSLSSVVR